MLDKHNVISGVPQGTVLASLFFIIMVVDIDQNLNLSISRLFTDNTKVSAKIKTQEDMELLPQDLNTIYKWRPPCNMHVTHGRPFRIFFYSFILPGRSY